MKTAVNGRAILAASFALAALPASAQVTDAMEIGTIYGNCPNSPVNILDVEGWPQDARFNDQLDAFQALVTCQVTQIDYKVHWGIVGQDGKVVPDAGYLQHANELQAILDSLPAEACDPHPDCGTKVNNWVNIWCGSIPQCTCTQCTGTCTDGTEILPGVSRGRGACTARARAVTGRFLAS